MEQENEFSLRFKDLIGFEHTKDMTIEQIWYTLGNARDMIYYTIEALNEKGIPHKLDSVLSILNEESENAQKHLGGFK